MSTEPKSLLQALSEWMTERIRAIVPEGVIVVNEWQNDLETQISKATGVLNCAVVVYRPETRYNGSDTDTFELNIRIDCESISTSEYNNYAIAELIGIALHGSEPLGAAGEQARFWQLRMQWASTVEAEDNRTIISFTSPYRIKKKATT